MNLSRWFHHLFNPHCRECIDEASENKICESCETLKMQLAIANAEKRTMLDALLEKNKPAEAAPMKTVNLEEVKSRQMTWNVRRQMLEAEDRKRAELLRKSTPQAAPVAQQASQSESPVQSIDESIKELERELGVEEDAKPADVHG